jgi:hypothetical protein
MTDRQLMEIWEKTGGHCHFCGDWVDLRGRGWKRGALGTAPAGHWEVDHVAQRAKGGMVSVLNCLPACIPCDRLRWHRRGRDIREVLLLGARGPRPGAEDNRARTHVAEARRGAGPPERGAAPGALVACGRQTAPFTGSPRGSCGACVVGRSPECSPVPTGRRSCWTASSA